MNADRERVAKWLEVYDEVVGYSVHYNGTEVSEIFKTEEEAREACRQAVEDGEILVAYIRPLTYAEEVRDGQERDRDRAIILRTVEACARAEGYLSFRETDWEIGIDAILGRKEGL